MSRKLEPRSYSSYYMISILQSMKGELAHWCSPEGRKEAKETVEYNNRKLVCPKEYMRLTTDTYLDDIIADLKKRIRNIEALIDKQVVDE